MTYTGLKEKWLNFARQLQSLARKQNGVAKIEATVIVDSDGNPLFWEEPRLTKYSPCLEASRTIITAIAQNKSS